MFHYLDGMITILEEGLAVVDCGGVGFACHTTNTTLSQLKIGAPYRLFTHCNIREDAFDVFGFSTREELNLFQSLLSISGVGPKAALSLLSVMPPERFRLAVLTGDERSLTAAQGVGKKMAQRVILELKDKLGSPDGLSGDLCFSPGDGAPTGKMAEIMAALTGLGYAASEAGSALRGIDVENLPIEEIIRKALRAMLHA